MAIAIPRKVQAQAVVTHATSGTLAGAGFFPIYIDPAPDGSFTLFANFTGSSVNVAHNASPGTLAVYVCIDPNDGKAFLAADLSGSNDEDALVPLADTGDFLAVRNVDPSPFRQFGRLCVHDTNDNLLHDGATLDGDTVIYTTKGRPIPIEHSESATTYVFVVDDTPAESTLEFTSASTTAATVKTGPLPTELEGSKYGFEVSGGGVVQVVDRGAVSPNRTELPLCFDEDGSPSHMRFCYAGSVAGRFVANDKTTFNVKVLSAQPQVYFGTSPPRVYFTSPTTTSGTCGSTPQFDPDFGA